ncbi:sporulation protein YqfD [Ammonifex degensii KC4]|uniref:Sporulation protein YqfD n=1 Tax=Ammonifex degensii (strain DSM 10501 / KC4) TaxID=429009 RepID=C9RAM9_AMMDK|nr:sporulation protein YqfD [Ammonifex degensii]ACX51306.1 sporulation protein YqfD [Ammonifex degensii KC4]
MALRFFRYLRGYVLLKLEGKKIERFLNMALTRGIKFWDVRYLGKDRVLLRVRWGAVRALRHISRLTSTRLTIQEKMGLPFLIGRLKRRRAFLGGALFFLALIYFLSLFVWRVEVTGAQKLSPAEILKVAAQAGLKPGVLHRQVNGKEVERVLKEQLPQLAWVGVEVRGTQAIIKVVEKKLPEPAAGPAHIVARKAGLIKELLVLEGTPKVKEGDTVLPGQVLIAGEEMVVPQGESELRPVCVRAKGMVKARVWYQGYSEAQLEERGERPTGRKAQSLFLEVGGHRWRLYGSSSPPFGCYRVEEKRHKLSLGRNFSLPVAVEKKVYYEWEPYKLRRTPQEARRLAEERARSYLRACLPEGARLIGEQVEEVKGPKEEGLIRVSVRWEVEEDIGQVKEFTPEGGQEGQINGRNQDPRGGSAGGHGDSGPLRRAPEGHREGHGSTVTFAGRRVCLTR